MTATQTPYKHAAQMVKEFQVFDLLDATNLSFLILRSVYILFRTFCCAEAEWPPFLTPARYHWSRRTMPSMQPVYLLGYASCLWYWQPLSLPPGYGPEHGQYFECQQTTMSALWPTLGRFVSIVNTVANARVDLGHDRLRAISANHPLDIRR